MTTNTMPRPAAPARMDKRAAVWYMRELAAYDLAARTGEPVTVDAYETAFDLLAHCTRYALAQTRHDENETAENYRAAWYVKRGEQLARSRDKLDSELARYGCRLQCLGYFCNNVYPYDFDRHCVTGNGFLHFFN